jgi:hypothetical protein
MGSKDGLTINECLSLASSIEAVSNRKTVGFMVGVSNTNNNILVLNLEAPFLMGCKGIRSAFDTFEMVRFFGLVAYEKWVTNVDGPKVILETNGTKYANIHISKTFDPENVLNGTQVNCNNTIVYIREDNQESCEFIASNSNSDETWYSVVGNGDRKIFLVGTSNFFVYKMVLTLNIFTDEEYSIDEDFEITQKNKALSLLREAPNEES